jgi:hypothetical protein
VLLWKVRKRRIVDRVILMLFGVRRSRRNETRLIWNWQRDVRQNVQHRGFCATAERCRNAILNMDLKGPLLRRCMSNVLLPSNSVSRATSRAVVRPCCNLKSRERRALTAKLI